MSNQKFCIEVTEDDVKMIEALATALLDNEDWPAEHGVPMPHIEALAKALGSLSKLSDPTPQVCTPWPIVKFHSATKELALGMLNIHRGLGIKAPAVVEDILSTSLDGLTFEDREAIEAEVTRLRARVEDLETEISTMAEDLESTAMRLKNKVTGRHSIRY